MAKKRIKLEIALPKGWGDLSSADVKCVARYMSSPGDPLENTISLAATLAGLMSRGKRTLDDSGEVLYLYYHRDRGNVILNAEQIGAIVNAMRWVAEENISLMAAPELDGYTTPDHRLYGISMEQFITALTAYTRYANTRNIEALRMLAATLYARTVYNPDLLAGDTQRIARLDIDLYSVFLWFSGSIKHLESKYPYVFTPSGESGGSASGVDMLLGMLSSLNDGDVSKNTAIKAIDTHEALHELNLKIKKSQTK